jgi:hypothetical protein
MLWFFDRKTESLTVETRYDSGTSGFVAIVRYPDGRACTERFTDAATFRSWLEAFERELERQLWKARSGPIVVGPGSGTRNS